MPRAIKAACGVLAAVVMVVSALSGNAQAADWRALVQPFEVKADKYYTDYGFSSNHYAYTESELRMLAVVIHLEARGEPYACKLAVGNVVMNRVLASGYPGDTIAQVVKRPNQFCYNSAVKPNSECLKAARDVLKYEAWAVPQNTYFFRASSSRSDWGSHDYATRLGRTAFYRHSYAGRSNSSAVPARLYQRVTRWPQYGCKPAARVRKVQAMLRGVGYKLTVDGYFGMETKKAVLAFQKAHGLVADGIVGPATLRKLISKYGISNYQRL